MEIANGAAVARSVFRALPALLAAASLASCFGGREERAVGVYLPLDVRFVTPSCGPCSGGTSHAVWIAAGSRAGEPGLAIEVGGKPAAVVSVAGPVSGWIWTVWITAPQLSRGRHSVRVVLAGGEEDALEGAFTAVPDNLSVSPVILTTGHLRPAATGAGEFDGRPGTDVAVCHELPGPDRKISILANKDGVGGFVRHAEIDADESAGEICAGDWNGDGWSEVATVGPVGPGQGQLTVFLSEAGALRPAQAVAIPAEPLKPLAADLDGDGALDLVSLSASSAAPSLEVRLNDGRGRFHLLQTVALPAPPSGFVSGQFEPDKMIDLAVSAGSQNLVYLLSGVGGGSLSVPFPAASAPSPGALGAGDFDRDGDLDLVFDLTGSNAFQMGINGGTGNFAGGTVISTLDRNAMVRTLDFDLDGCLDVLVISGRELAVYCCDGMGAAIPGRELHHLFLSALKSVEIFDINSDEFADIFVTEPGMDTAWICHNTSQ